MNMAFEDFFVDSSDFNFYLSLPEDERLLFLYDLICTDYYTEEEIHYPEEQFNADNFSTDINKHNYREIISAVLNKAVDLDAHVNVIFINELVVFNSDSKRNLSYAILDMAFDGVFLDKINVPENLIEYFKKQEYFEVYKVLEITEPILPKS